MAIRVALLSVLTVAVLALAACSGQADSGTTAPPASTTVSTASTASTVGGGASTTSPESSTTASSAASGAASDLLTAADVEKVSGLTGIKNIDKGAQAGAGGDVNFVDGGGALVLMANFYDGSQFDALKQTPNYREPLAGLGEAAFVGPSKDIMATLYEVGFKKGDHTALLVTYFKTGTGGQQTILTMAQLKELAAIVASRW